MWVFTEHERRRYKDYCIIVVVSILLHFLRGMNLLTAMGCMTVVMIAAELISMILGRLLARIMYERVYFKSIKELKHTEKQYQYILQTPKKDIYTYVYNKPLSEVEVKCWKFQGSYLIEVSKKHKTRSE